MSTFRESSRKEWVGSAREDINAGSLQRIADALEKIASSWDQLRAERDDARDSRDYWRGKAQEKDRRIGALRGVITKMKRRAK